MADAKLTALTDMPTPSPDDILYIVDAPSGTPASRKITHSNLFKLSAGLDALTNETYHGICLTGRNYGYTAAIGDPVYLDDTAGEWLKADANLSGAWPARGIACNAAGDGQAAIVMVLGVMRFDTWAFTEGQSLYLSTTGTITGTVPSTSGDCIQIVGFALSDDEAFFNFTGVYAELT